MQGFLRVRLSECTWLKRSFLNVLNKGMVLHLCLKKMSATLGVIKLKQTDKLWYAQPLEEDQESTAWERKPAPPALLKVFLSSFRRQTDRKFSRYIKKKEPAVGSRTRSDSTTFPPKRHGASRRRVCWHTDPNTWERIVCHQLLSAFVWNGEKTDCETPEAVPVWCIVLRRIELILTHVSAVYAKLPSFVDISSCDL